jgi:RNA polymerase sigma factor (sigma-70 family)
MKGYSNGYIKVLRFEFQTEIMPILKNLKYLDPRENFILRMRYGIEPYEQTYTFREIAKAFGVHPSRIQVLLKRAIKKLKKGGN